MKTEQKSLLVTQTFGTKELNKDLKSGWRVVETCTTGTGAVLVDLYVIHDVMYVLDGMNGVIAANS